MSTIIVEPYQQFFNLPKVLGVNPTDIAVNNFASLQEWWRADIGFSAGGKLASTLGYGLVWLGRKRYNPAIPTTGHGENPAWYPVQEPNSFNGQTALRYADLIEHIGLNGGSSVIATASNFTIGYVGCASEAGIYDGFMVGNAAAPSSVTCVVHQASTFKVRFFVGGSLLLESPSGYAPSSPHYALASFDKLGGTASLRVNGAEVASASGVGLTNTDSSLYFGAGNLAFAANRDGRLFNAFAWNQALHLAPLANRLVQLDAYVNALYGL